MRLAGLGTERVLVGRFTRVLKRYLQDAVSRFQASILDRSSFRQNALYENRRVAASRIIPSGDAEPQAGRPCRDSKDNTSFTRQLWVNLIPRLLGGQERREPGNKVDFGWELAA